MSIKKSQQLSSKSFDAIKLVSLKLLEFIVKLAILEKCESGLDFKNIDLYSSENIKGNNLWIGYAEATIISDLKKKDIVKKTELKQFKSGGKTFLITLLVTFFEESPLGSALVCNSVVLIQLL